MHRRETGCPSEFSRLWHYAMGKPSLWYPGMCGAPTILVLQGRHLVGSKLLALKNPWVQKAFLASYLTYKIEVFILVHKSLPCIVEAVHMDPQGRFVVLVLAMWQRRYVFAGIQVPPPFKPKMLHSFPGENHLFACQNLTARRF